MPTETKPQPKQKPHALVDRARKRVAEAQKNIDKAIAKLDPELDREQIDDWRNVNPQQQFVQLTCAEGRDFLKSLSPAAKKTEAFDTLRKSIRNKPDQQRLYWWAESILALHAE